MRKHEGPQSMASYCLKKGNLAIPVQCCSKIAEFSESALFEPDNNYFVIAIDKECGPGRSLDPDNLMKIYLANKS